VTGANDPKITNKKEVFVTLPINGSDFFSPPTRPESGSRYRSTFASLFVRHSRRAA
jgi:hypothetical protein